MMLCTVLKGTTIYVFIAVLYVFTSLYISSCVRGNLVEINEILTDNPNLIKTKVKNSGNHVYPLMKDKNICMYDYCDI